MFFFFVADFDRWCPSQRLRCHVVEREDWICGTGT